jgi:hypothetical protein
MLLEPVHDGKKVEDKGAIQKRIVSRGVGREEC